MSRLLFVHPHPDDETLLTGVTIAHHAARGDEVTVLTCTLGEEGEVIPAELAHLEGAPGDPLAPVRREELSCAAGVLGATSLVLGEAGSTGPASRYRDSGMPGSAAAADPRAFVNAPVDEAAGLVADVIHRIDPDVVVTIDPTGTYGHPDHVQTHRVTCAAVALLDDPPALYAVVKPRSWSDEDRSWLAEHPRDGWTVPSPDAPHDAYVVADEIVTHAVVDPAAVAVQARALACHRTQVTVDGERYALSNDIAARLAGREGFARMDPATGQLVAAPAGSTRHTGLEGM